MDDIESKKRCLLIRIAMLCCRCVVPKGQARVLRLMVLSFTGKLGIWKQAGQGLQGFSMLFAEREGTALAFACSTPWRQMSAGFVGISDGWQDISKNFEMTWNYERAQNGNIALTGEIDLTASKGEFVIAIGFGGIWSEAGQQALSSILDGFEVAREEYLRHWENWQSLLLPLDEVPRERDLYRVSTAVLRTHESKSLLGGIIASLSIPWGFNKGDEDLGGYHLIWPRDLVETASALLAAGAVDDSMRVLRYLEVTQEADGHWAQNLWLDGRPYWGGLQMDETSLPILLVDELRREAPQSLGELSRWWPMVRRAASFIVQNGPVTQQDRWEEDAGYSSFTLAAEVAALLAAADIADLVHEKAIAKYLRETADTWNECIDRWIYATGNDLCKQVGVEGYYVRISSAGLGRAASPLQGFVPIKNRPPDRGQQMALHVVSPDALALVRFGLRAADDPKILNTINVIDAILRVKLPQGPCWFRYNEDGYGEHADGSPFDGTGIGRPWPLLAGERAHYELAGGQAPSRGGAARGAGGIDLTRAASSRSKYGMAMIFRHWNCFAASRRGRRGRWCGHTQSTSSCGDHCGTERFSIRHLSRCSAI